MPADAALADSPLDAGEAELPPSKGSGLKRAIMLVVLPLLLLASGAAGLMLSGIFDPFGLSGSAEETPGEAAQVTFPDPASLVYFDLPDLLVNLDSGGKRPSYLKMRVSLEIASDQDRAAIEKLLPRIIDSFQMYLRELRMEDLRGSAGLARLREELLRRVSLSVQPIEIRDVLFREMLVQ